MTNTKKFIILGVAAFLVLNIGGKDKTTGDKTLADYEVQQRAPEAEAKFQSCMIEYNEVSTTRKMEYENLVNVHRTTYQHALSQGFNKIDAKRYADDTVANDRVLLKKSTEATIRKLKQCYEIK